MSKKFIPQHPATGKPIKTGKRSRNRSESRKQISGPWDAIPKEKILQLATGEISSLVVNWRGEVSVYRVDAIRALPRLIGTLISEVHSALIDALTDDDENIRIAGLESMPICAEQDSDSLIDYLAELLDDDSAIVRKKASMILAEMAPTFPSACHTLLHIELRHEHLARKNQAWNGLRNMIKFWPEVVMEHIDTLIREEWVELRRSASSLLSRLIKSNNSTLWDLIGWCLDDDDDIVRRNAAKTIRPLSELNPSIGLILAERSMLDDDEIVREYVLKGLHNLDATTRLKSLVFQGCKSKYASVRSKCVLILPKLLTDTELRDYSREMLSRETDTEIKSILEEYILDLQLEGDEFEKNKYLAPAEPIPSRDKEIILAESSPTNITEKKPSDEEEKGNKDAEYN